MALDTPTTPVFQAVNAMDITPNEPPELNMSTPTDSRNRLSPSPQYEFRAPQSSSPAYRVSQSTENGQSQHLASSGNGHDESNGSNVQEDADGMDEGNGNAEAGKSGNGSKSTGKAKKKKGQKFFCTGFGECGLAFTRSEHLARHIRFVGNTRKHYYLYTRQIWL
jgi:hypothetical protein